MISESAEVLQHAATAIKRTAAKTGRKQPDKWDFANWLHRHLTVKRNRELRPWSLAGYEPYAEIVNNLHRHEESWFLKGTQIGFSTIFIGWNLYLPEWRGLDCGYCLPDKVMIRPFMKTRFGKEQIENNPDLKRAYRLHETDMFYDAGSHYLYFLGVNVLSETLSKPIDSISLDEVTIIDRDSIEMIQERLDASSFGQLNAFAREIYPGGPADQGFQAGTQNVMLFKCSHCGEWQNLEDEFYRSSLGREEQPRCVAQDSAGQWQIICMKCSKPYRRSECGHWVAKFPGRPVQSYRIPQVIFEGMDLQRLMRKWLKSAAKKSQRTKLHSSMLAIPDAGDLQRITRETITRLKRDYRMQRSATWSVGGVDMGDTCYAVFADFVDDVMRVVWFQEINADEVEEVVSELIMRMNCMKIVIDGMPLTTAARRLAYEFPENVVLNYYRGNELVEDEREHAGIEYQIVTQDREQALDDYCDLFDGDPKIIFPARVIEPDGREVDLEDSTFAAHHYIGSQKDEMDDPRLGKKVFKYKKHVANHFFHAGNYLGTAMALLAREEGRFVGAVPIFGSFAR